MLEENRERRRREDRVFEDIYDKVSDIGKEVSEIHTAIALISNDLRHHIENDLGTFRRHEEELKEFKSGEFDLLKKTVEKQKPVFTQIVMVRTVGLIFLQVLLAWLFSLLGSK